MYVLLPWPAASTFVAVTFIVLSLLGTVTAELVRSRYMSFWNSPWPTQCAAPLPSFPNFTRWGISTNVNATFLGDSVATFYHLGNFPFFSGMGPGGACADGDWNCTNATAHFGGLPQLLNVTEHLQQFQADLEQQLPDPTWSGVGVIDWEAWAPNYTSCKYNEYWIYTNRSVELVLSRHPDWNMSVAAAAAEKEFNTAAKALWIESIRLAKRLRPNGVWGWYNYPGLASRFDLDWLYDEVTALFPSLYLVSNNVTENRQRVDSALSQARAVRDDIVARGGRLLPMYSYTWQDYKPRYVHSETFINGVDIDTEFMRGADRWGLTGTILWGASSDAENATRCSNGTNGLTAYIDSVLGPALRNASDTADACAAKRCNNHGTCWSGVNGTAELCDCDRGFNGPHCV